MVRWINHTPYGHLVPFGHYRCNPKKALQSYQSYGRDLSAGTLVIASYYRILSYLTILWFCDNQATKSFLDNAPDQPKVEALVNIFVSIHFGYTTYPWFEK